MLVAMEEAGVITLGVFGRDNILLRSDAWTPSSLAILSMFTASTVSPFSTNLT